MESFLSMSKVLLTFWEVRLHSLRKPLALKIPQATDFKGFGVQKSTSHPNQSFQKSLIKEYALHQIGIPILIYAIFLS